MVFLCCLFLSFFCFGFVFVNFALFCFVIGLFFFCVVLVIVFVFVLFLVLFVFVLVCFALFVLGWFVMFVLFFLLSLFGLFLFLSVCLLDWSKCCYCFVYFSVCFACVCLCFCVCFCLFLNKSLFPSNSNVLGLLKKSDSLFFLSASGSYFLFLFCLLFVSRCYFVFFSACSLVLF